MFAKKDHYIFFFLTRLFKQNAIYAGFDIQSFNSSDSKYVGFSGTHPEAYNFFLLHIAVFYY